MCVCEMLSDLNVRLHCRQQPPCSLPIPPTGGGFRRCLLRRRCSSLFVFSANPFSFLFVLYHPFLIHSDLPGPKSQTDATFIQLSDLIPDATPGRVDQDRLSKLPLLRSPCPLAVQQNPSCWIQGLILSSFRHCY